jgi:8-oxo-dGTP pyrophosphatase MutT (NUDIX family)
MEPTKSLRKAVSLVFRKDALVFIAKRSPTKDSYPSAWSLPSTYIHDGETKVDAAKRLAKTKLNLTNVTIGDESVGVSAVVDRGEYLLQMEDLLVT